MCISLNITPKLIDNNKEAGVSGVTEVYLWVLYACNISYNNNMSIHHCNHFNVNLTGYRNTHTVNKLNYYL